MQQKSVVEVLREGASTVLCKVWQHQFFGKISSCNQTHATNWGLMKSVLLFIQLWPLRGRKNIWSHIKTCNKNYLRPLRSCLQSEFCRPFLIDREKCYLLCMRVTLKAHNCSFEWSQQNKPQKQKFIQNKSCLMARAHVKNERLLVCYRLPQSFTKLTWETCPLHMR